MPRRQREPQHSTDVGELTFPLQWWSPGRLPGLRGQPIVDHCSADSEGEGAAASCRLAAIGLDTSSAAILIGLAARWAYRAVV